MYSDVQVKSTLGRAAQELGYSKLHPQQEIAVQMFVQGHDVFVGLPTGSGKSHLLPDLRNRYLGLMFCETFSYTMLRCACAIP